MEELILKAAIREEKGKNVCRRLRRQDLIPGIVYKGKTTNVNVQFASRDLWHALHTTAGENAIITMDISGVSKKIKKTVIVKEIQRDPVNDKFVHVDFHEISLTQKIKVKVPIVAKGEAAGVKEDGIMTQEIWELEIECMPTDIPERMEVNVDNLGIGDALYVKDIVVSDKIKILANSEQVIVSIVPPMAEEVKEEVPLEGVEEPEVIKKGKVEEEEVPSEEEEKGKEKEAEASPKEKGKEKPGAK